MAKSYTGVGYLADVSLLLDITGSLLMRDDLILLIRNGINQ